MPNFMELLLEIVAPRLKVFRYRYNENMNYIGNSLYDNKLMSGDISYEDMVYFGFHKKLVGDNYSFIVFQRSQTNQMVASGNRFSVYLMRHRPISLRKWFLIRNATKDALPKTNIGYVMHHAFQLNDVSSENWWDPRNEVEAADFLQEAAYYIEKYAIPWIENPSSRPIDLKFSGELYDFNKMVQFTLQDKMLKNGFLLKHDTSTNTVYFSKQTSSGKNLHVVFGFGFDINGYKRFDVLLYRTKSFNPLDHTQINNDDIDRVTSSLGFVLQKVYNMSIRQIESAIQTNYTSMEQLVLRLDSVYEIVAHYALPWLEEAKDRG